jgi:hypothetical protein
MTARLVEPADPAWLDVLRSTRHDFYHLPAYATLCARTDGGTPRALLVQDGSRRLLLPMTVRDDLPGGRRDGVSPYGYPGPLVAGPDPEDFLVAALLEGQQMLREQAFASLFVRLHPLLNASPPSGAGTLVEHGQTVSLDLTLDERRLWAGMRRDHRHDVQVAIERGYVARMDDGLERMEAFKRLYSDTMDRLGAASQYRFDDDYFEALRSGLGERLHLCVVELDGAVAAAGLFVDTGGLIQYHLSGSDPAHARGPGKLMLWFAATWGRARGCHTLHLGGGVGGGNDSLMAFKAGFSPRRHPFFTLRMVVDEPAYQELLAERHGLLAPDDLTGFFPGYRLPA